jgi:hypothetical protein
MLFLHPCRSTNNYLSGIKSPSESLERVVAPYSPPVGPDLSVYSKQHLLNLCSNTPPKSAKMPRYSIYPESLVAPNKFSPFLSVSFRRGVESRDPIVSPLRHLPAPPWPQSGACHLCVMDA